MSDPLLPIPWLDVLIIIGLIMLNRLPQDLAGADDVAAGRPTGSVVSYTGLGWTPYAVPAMTRSFPTTPANLSMRSATSGACWDFLISRRR